MSDDFRKEWLNVINGIKEEMKTRVKYKGDGEVLGYIDGYVFSPSDYRVYAIVVSENEIERWDIKALEPMKDDNPFKQRVLNPDDLMPSWMKDQGNPKVVLCSSHIV